MKFSIITPVYNAEAYLEACIGSVLHQSYQAFELLLIDDGSSDRSGQICDAYAEAYPEKVKVFHCANRGPFIARMHGIAHADGDAVLFVDADDAIHPDALAQLQHQFEKTSCDMVCFNASRQADFSAPCFSFPFQHEQCFSGDTKKRLYEVFILHGDMNSLCLKAVKREVLSAVPQAYSYFTGRNAEDLLLVLPLITAAQKVVFIDQALYYYRSNPQSIVHSYNPSRHLSIKKVHMEMEAYIDRWGMQAYHAKHYVREVRGWVDCLKLMLASTKKTDGQLLRELAEDPYFRRAFVRMEPGILTKKDALLSKWLYKKQYARILVAGKALRFVRSVKQRKKGAS